MASRLKPRTFHRVFIANRGEVAVRIAKTCDALGITPVFGVSESDADAPYADGRESIVLGPARAERSYLDLRRVMECAREMRCSALHPGWGFLSENARFATLCEQQGITFIGPPPSVMALMSQKSPAKQAMRSAGLALIPGSNGVLENPDEARRVATDVGYPVLIKAEAGGGGRGMRVARAEDEVEARYHEAQAEAVACFGDGRLYLEKLIEGGRHVEIQVLADRYGNVVHLGERDCTIQRHHQKLLEESPSPSLDPDERERTLTASVRATASIGYVGAGTMEFLLDEGGTLRFMEMNTRLQVEHCVSEMRTGIDLVAEQIRVAAGGRLPFSQQDIRFDGHAIECRINAEDPTQGFRPSPGTVTRFSAPRGADIRVDTHVTSGYRVPPYYDSLLCKVVTRGETRDDAADRMRAALDSLVCEGVATTVAMHQAILGSPEFRANAYDTRGIPGFEGA